MQLAPETKALGWAVLAALLSLVGAGLAALFVKAMPNSGAATTSVSSDASFPALASTPEAIARGHAFYGMSCSHCHGDDATGDEGPTLHNLTISNARIAATIKKGVKGEMPTFAKKYDDQQIAALIIYLRTLR